VQGCETSSSGHQGLANGQTCMSGTSELHPYCRPTLKRSVARQVTHGETIQSPQRTAQAILTLSLNYSRARKKKSDIDRHGWVKPREDYVKLNVDAGFCADSGSGSTRAIIRDDTGRFIAASCCGTLCF
jgi:hypothetical protein